MSDGKVPCDWCGATGIDMQQGSDVPCWFCGGTGRTSVPRRGVGGQPAGSARILRAEPGAIGSRVLDRNGIAYTRFSDSERHNRGDWINEDAVIVQWLDIADSEPVAYPPGGGES